MDEFVNSTIGVLLSNGGTVVMAVLFIIFLFYDRKDRKDNEIKEQQNRKEERNANNKLLGELSASNRNIAESLNLLKTSIDNSTKEFRQHDDRAIQQFSNINEKLIIVTEKLSK